MAVLYPKRWDAVTDKCIVEESKCPTLPRALEKFDKIRGINSERQTGLVTLSIRWRDGEQAAFWANDLVVRLNQEMRSRVIAQADASLEYLQRELGVTSQIETRDAINRLVDGQVKQRMLASVSAEYSFRVVDPATAPDPRDPVWPKKWLFLLLGAVGGLLIGVGAILVSVEVTRPQRT